MAETQQTTQDATTIQLPDSFQAIERRMDALGYEVDGEGVCKGLAIMWLQAVLVGEEAQFVSRVRLILNKPSLAMMIRPNRKRPFNHPSCQSARFFKFPRSLGYEDQKYDQQAVFDAHAFLSGVYAHQFTERLPSAIFGEKRNQANMTGNLRLTQPSKLIEDKTNYLRENGQSVDEEQEKHGVPNLAMLYSEPVIGDYQHVNQFFEQLISAFDDNSKASIALLISSPNHAMGIRYHIERKQWILMDPNSSYLEPISHSANDDRDNTVGGKLIDRLKNMDGQLAPDGSLKLEVAVYSTLSMREAIGFEMPKQPLAGEWSENKVHEYGDELTEFFIRKNTAQHFEYFTSLGLDADSVSYRAACRGAEQPLKALFEGGSSIRIPVDVLASSTTEVIEVLAKHYCRPRFDHMFPEAAVQAAAHGYEVTAEILVRYVSNRILLGKSLLGASEVSPALARPLGSIWYERMLRLVSEDQWGAAFDLLNFNIKAERVREVLGFHSARIIETLLNDQAYARNNIIKIQQFVRQCGERGIEVKHQSGTGSLAELAAEAGVSLGTEAYPESPQHSESLAAEAFAGPNSSFKETVQYSGAQLRSKFERIQRIIVKNGTLFNTILPRSIWESLTAIEKLLRNSQYAEAQTLMQSLLTMGHMIASKAFKSSDATDDQAIAELINAMDREGFDLNPGSKTALSNLAMKQGLAQTLRVLSNYPYETPKYWEENAVFQFMANQAVHDEAKQLIADKAPGSLKFQAEAVWRMAQLKDAYLDRLRSLDDMIRNHRYLPRVRKKKLQAGVDHARDSISELTLTDGLTEYNQKRLDEAYTALHGVCREPVVMSSRAAVALIDALNKISETLSRLLNYFAAGLNSGQYLDEVNAPRPGING